MEFSPDSIQHQLTHSPLKSPRFCFRTPKRAAVALILKNQENQTSVLFIQRAVRHGDPWSGHMALPGGHHEKQDPSFQETASRETQEEVGLDLSEKGRYLGALSPLQAGSKGVLLPMLVHPQVFFLEDPQITLVANHEVAQTLWIPLSALRSERYHDIYIYHWGKIKKEFPCWNYEGKIIWGLTYRILNSFLDKMILH
jgi:8-oxo-dGTP pyrophosphatase MutT (NUDIX family)